MEGDITACWCLGAGKVHPQKRDSPFANVIACLDELMRHDPSCCEWDELVHLPLLAPSDTPCRGHHLGHILGRAVDIGSNMLVDQF